jgi:sterol desaturase/sphingolipid hydroxylase (fatty acid hydroxylase superfamily)
VGFLHDLAWFLINPLFLISMVYASKSFMNSSYVTHLSFLTVDVLRGWPVYLQVITIILALDFLHWFSHLLRHKVKVFWYFHSVHHSQRELNVFTDHRVHPLEHVISYAIRVLPLLALELKVAIPLGIGWWLFSHWHTAAYHANIRSNYGILRYILVTPQSHRIHHSREAVHQDKNFGVFFSIWDHIFGTQYRGYDEYPETGIADENFPLENDTIIKDQAVTLFRQLVYPFALIVKRGRSAENPASGQLHKSTAP